MNKHFQNITLKATGANKLLHIETIQSLWSGYGAIERYGLQGCAHNSVIIKHIRLPQQNQHPRGWNTDLSHQRKIKSYQVEMAWYQHWSKLCNNACRVPHCLATESRQDEMFILLEDLNSSGFPLLKAHVSNNEIQALTDRPLKQAAAAIDQKLRASSFQTIIHGDAKLANFCFSADGKSVAAVDFQYVGGGCGMKDVAYFIGSCLDEQQCQQQEAELLEYYFHALKKALAVHNKTIDPSAVEQDWRVLYPVAWTDFHRFLKGWSPGHWKINSYSERLAHEVIAQLAEIN